MNAVRSVPTIGAHSSSSSFPKVLVERRRKTSNAIIESNNNANNDNKATIIDKEENEKDKDNTNFDTFNANLNTNLHESLNVEQIIQQHLNNFKNNTKNNKEEDDLVQIETSSTTTTTSSSTFSYEDYKNNEFNLQNISLSEMLNKMNLIIKLSEQLINNKNNKIGNLIKNKLITIYEEMKLWNTEDLFTNNNSKNNNSLQNNNLQKNNEQLIKALQLLNLQINNIFNLLNKILKSTNLFLEFRFTKKCKFLLNELENITTLLGISISYYKAQIAYKQVHKLGIVTGFPNLEIFYDLNDKVQISLIADRYYFGHGILQNYEIAFRLYLKSSKLGDARSQYICSKMYKNGIGCKQDFDKSLKYLLKACSQDYPDALNEIGKLFESGCFVIDGCNVFNYSHGYGYDSGCDNSGYGYVEKNEFKALKFYLRACHLNHCDAMSNYANLLLQNNVEIDQAIYWLKKSAYELNYHKSQNELGIIYYKGLYGIKREIKKAIDLFTRAANQGNEFALNNLGIAYEEGKVDCINNEMTTSNDSNNNDINEKMIKKKDYFKAQYYYEQAIIVGGNVNAICNLGYLKLIQKQFDVALQLLHEANDRGSIEAMYHLGNVYQFGLGVEIDLLMAYKYYLKSANLGHVKACRMVGDFLYSGIPNDIKSDKQLAAKYYRKIALKDAESANNLGIMYEEGCILNENKELSKELALKWYSKAIELGSEKAIINYNKLVNK